MTLPWGKDWEKLTGLWFDKLTTNGLSRGA
jgi:hypothetical protein